jgi:hypothetical protein
MILVEMAIATNDVREARSVNQADMLYRIQHVSSFAMENICVIILLLCCSIKKEHPRDIADRSDKKLRRIGANVNRSRIMRRELLKNDPHLLAADGTTRLSPFIYTG